MPRVVHSRLLSPRTTVVPNRGSGCRLVRSLLQCCDKAARSKRPDEEPKAMASESFTSEATTSPIAGGVDCDLHPAVPHLTSLLPYLNEYWRDQVTTRGMTDLVSQSYPTHSPISARPDWRPARGKPGSNLEDMKTHALDPFKVSYGICNPPFGRQMVFADDIHDAFCRALDDWLTNELLDRETRPLRSVR